MGVDPTTVHLSTDPRDTGEEAERARGLDPIPAPAQAYALRGAGPGHRDLLPSATGYLKVECAVHEWLGLLWARMTVGAAERP